MYRNRLLESVFDSVIKGGRKSSSLKETTADNVYSELPEKFTAKTLRGIIEQLSEYGFEVVDQHNDWLYLEDDNGAEWEAEVTHYFRGGYELMAYNIAKTGSKIDEAYEGGYETFRNHIGELDTAYNPYKKVADAPDLDKDFDMWTSGKGSSTDTSDFSTLDGSALSDEFRKSWSNLDFLENNMYDVEKECRLSHDWNEFNAYKRKVVNARAKHSKILAAAYDLYKDGKFEGLSDKLLDYCEKKSKKDTTVAKRKATMAANAGARKEKAMSELPAIALETVKIPELRELLNDDGTLKERRSWGTIKGYFNTDDGKLLKKLWIAQFGK